MEKYFMSIGYRSAGARAGSSFNNERRYSARNVSSGESKLARNAGIKDATNADNPSITTATNVTTGSYGLKP